MPKIMEWFKELFCSHTWVHYYVNRGYYDEESWYICTKCGKERD